LRTDEVLSSPPVEEVALRPSRDHRHDRRDLKMVSRQAR